MVRQLAERLSRNVILRRRFPALFGGGQIFVSPGSALRYWRMNLEQADAPLLQNILELVHPGDQVWDIGANVGLFAFAAAGLAGLSGRVLAVEPDTWLVALMRRSARLDSETRAKVEILPAAVSDRTGIGEFCLAERGRSANHLSGKGSSQTGGCRERHSVMTVTLDWLLEQYPVPNIVKIDVEGAEDRVLQGAKRLFSVVQPRLLIEVSGENSVWITDFLISCGYTLYDAELPRDERQPLKCAVWNTLALPGGISGRVLR